MPDLKLKAAMEEIKVILKNYDIAAIVLLSSESNIEYLREFKTSWSCMWLEPSGMVRVRWKRSEFASQEAYKRSAEATIGTIAGFADAARNESEQMVKLLKVIGANGIEFDHMTKEEPPE